jgi:hypothetical protein
MKCAGGLIMGIYVANGSLLANEKLKDVLRRLIPRLLVGVFLAILATVYLTRFAVFCTIVSLAFQK